MKILVLLAMLIVPAQSLGECSHDPFAIVSVEKYRDGGTVVASITDSTGCLVECRYDGRIDSPTLGSVYVDGRLARGAAEHRIFRLVSAVVDSSMSRIEREESQGLGSDEERDGVRRQAFYLEEMLEKCGWR